MYQKDYILRMLEMLAELIAGILGLLKKGDLEQAAAMLERAYVDFLKEDAAFFRRIPPERLTTQLLEEHHYTHDHLKILSELFYAEAEIELAAANRENSLEYFEKALILMSFVEKNSHTFSLDSQSKMSLIQGKIEQLKA